jgi:predicted dehydrogenase
MSATTDLIPVGAIGLGDNSHLNYSIGAPRVTPPEPGKSPSGRASRLLITHCWDSRPEVADAFARRYGCVAVKSYHDMVGKVDGMVFGGYNEVPWWPQLTRPYLEAGIPCAINRPFAYSMRDAKAIVETARKHDTPIINTSAYDYLQQVSVARRKIGELLKDGRAVLGAHSTNSSDEWPQHGVHGLYYLLSTFGYDVETAGYQADGWWRVATGSATKQHFGQLTLQFRGVSVEGMGEQRTPFLVSQFQTSTQAHLTLRVYHDRGWWDTVHDATPAADQNLLFFFYPTILAMQRLFESRQMPCSYDQILQKTRVFLAAFKSHLEHGGSQYLVDHLPDDWVAPNPYPDWIDGAIFER